MYTFACSDSRFAVFCGDDKFENELLLKYARNCDVWFHVSGFSSAHVYLTLPRGLALQDVPAEVLQFCGRLTKVRSLQGVKQPTVDIDYCYAANLRTLPEFEVGTVTFSDSRAVRKLRNVAAPKSMARALNALARHVPTNEAFFRDALHAHNAATLAEQKRAAQLEREAAERCDAERLAAQRLKHYEDLHVGARPEPRGDGSLQSCREIEDDFM